MGVKGMTSYIRSNYGSLFRAAEVAAHRPLVLVVDYSAFVHHLMNLIRSHGLCDGGPMHAFSFVMSFLKVLESDGVELMNYVKDGILPPDSVKADTRAERACEEVLRHSEALQAPSMSGTPFDIIDTNWSTISEAISWFHKTSTMKANFLTADGEADRLVAATAAVLTSKLPKKNVFVLTNDSDMLFMQPSPDVIFLDDFKVNMTTGKASFKYLKADSLSGNGFQLTDPAFMPLLATLLPNDYLQTEQLQSFHDRVIRGEDITPMPDNIAGEVSERGCNAGVNISDKRHPHRLVGEYCVNVKCPFRHSAKRKKNFRSRPFFIKLVSSNGLDQATPDNLKAVISFIEDNLKRATGTTIEGTLRSALTNAGPEETPKGNFEFVLLGCQTYPVAEQPKAVVLFEHVQHFYIVKEALESDLKKPSWLKSATVKIDMFYLRSLELRSMRRLFQRDSNLLKDDGVLDSAYLANTYFGSSKKMENLFSTVFSQYSAAFDTALVSEDSDQCQCVAHPTPCNCSWTQNYAATQTASLIRRMEESYHDQYVDAGNSVAVRPTDLVSGLDRARYGAILGTATPVVFNDTTLERRDSAVRNTHKLSGELLKTEAGAAKALRPLCCCPHDSELLKLWGLDAAPGSAPDAAPDLSGWDQLSNQERTEHLAGTSPSLRGALLMQLLGVTDKADESDVLQKAGVEAGIATLAVGGAELPASSLSSLFQVPLSLVLPIAALRFWIKKCAELGDALSDAEVQAALSGITCVFEPGLASAATQGDPMARLHDFLATPDEEEEEDAHAGAGAGAPKKKKKKAPTVVRVKSVIAGRLFDLTGTLEKPAKELDPEEDYTVTPLPDPSVSFQSGWKTKEAMMGKHLEIINVKPDWVTALGLRRLDQWQVVLSKVVALAEALQLDFPQTNNLVIDPADFLFNHFTCMQGAGTGWHGSRYSGQQQQQGQKPEVYRTSSDTKKAMDRMQSSWRERSRKDPVRQNITNRCSGIAGADGSQEAASNRLINLFDALIAATQSTSIRPMVNVSVCKCASTKLVELQQQDDDDVADDWDASSSDEDEADAADGTVAENCTRALNSCLSAAAQPAAAGSSDAVAWASVRLMALLSRHELRQALKEDQEQGAGGVGQSMQQLSTFAKGEGDCDKSMRPSQHTNIKDFLGVVAEFS